MQRPVLILFVAAFLLAGSLQASAAMFCVSTTAQLIAALESSAGNNQSDEIRIVVGNYVAPTAPSGGFRVVAEGGFSTSVSGGWFSVGQPCDLQLASPAETVLSAQAVPGVNSMTLTTPNTSFTPELLVANLTLADGRGLAANGGCLRVFVDQGNPTVTLQQLHIRDCRNEQTNSASAVSLSNASNGSILFRSNLVRDSYSTNGAAVFATTTVAAATISVFNNTIAYNSTDPQSSNPAGLRAVASNGQGLVRVINNVVFNNGGGNQLDMFASESGVLMSSNVLGSPLSGPAALDGGWRLLGAPAAAFVELPGNLRLRTGSSLRDAGTLPLPQGFGARDADNAPRVQNGRVDIGAFELETLFANGFE